MLTNITDINGNSVSYQLRNKEMDSFINGSFIQINYIDDKNNLHALRFLPNDMKKIMNGSSKKLKIEYNHEISRTTINRN